jgi:hypothetical protein
MDAETWIPEEIPLDQHSSARVYDYWLGGSHNFEVDRIMGDKAAAIYPDVRLVAQANRAFLRRAVQFLVAQGIDQFLDIGSGIPTVGNVHEVAQTANPAARVVYVDIDPVAVAHSLAMLEDNPNATAIRADARQPDRILNHPEVVDLLDFNRPMAVLLLTILHAIADDEIVYGLVRTLRDALAPGSYMAITHATYDIGPKEILERLHQLYAHAGRENEMRTHTEIQRFFEGFEMVEPGLVPTPLWRPEGSDDVFIDEPERSMAFAGVGRKL